jgi:hypothetical protein
MCSPYAWITGRILKEDWYSFIVRSICLAPARLFSLNPHEADAEHSIIPYNLIEGRYVLYNPRHHVLTHDHTQVEVKKNRLLPSFARLLAKSLHCSLQSGILNLKGTEATACRFRSPSCHRLDKTMAWNFSHLQAPISANGSTNENDIYSFHSVNI